MKLYVLDAVLYGIWCFVCAVSCDCSTLFLNGIKKLQYYGYHLHVCTFFWFVIFFCSNLTCCNISALVQYECTIV